MFWESEKDVSVMFLSTCFYEGDAVVGLAGALPSAPDTINPCADHAVPPHVKNVSEMSGIATHGMDYAMRW